MPLPSLKVVIVSFSIFIMQTPPLPKVIPIPINNFIFALKASPTVWVGDQESYWIWLMNNFRVQVRCKPSYSAMTCCTSSITHCWQSHQGTFKVQYLAQGHFGIRIGGVRDRSIDDFFSGQRALPPVSQPPYTIDNQTKTVQWLPPKKALHDGFNQTKLEITIIEVQQQNVTS